MTSRVPAAVSQSAGWMKGLKSHRAPALSRSEFRTLRQYPESLAGAFRRLWQQKDERALFRSFSATRQGATDGNAAGAPLADVHAHAGQQSHGASSAEISHGRCASLQPRQAVTGIAKSFSENNYTIGQHASRRLRSSVRCPAQKTSGSRTSPDLEGRGVSPQQGYHAYPDQHCRGGA